MFDIGIIGSGPAGYTAAIRAAQLGLKVVLFEKNEIGGTCLNKGCIPTKALLHSADLYSTVKGSSKFGISYENLSFDYSKIAERKDKIVQKIRKSLTQLILVNNVEIVMGEASIVSNNLIEVSGDTFQCENIIIATGSQPNKFVFSGSYSDDFIMTSDDVLQINELPSSILIVGSGAIGIEWARIFSELGVAVSVVDIAPKLIPVADIDVSERIARIFRRNKIKTFLSTSVEKIEDKNIFLSSGETLTVDKVLVAVGRTPVLDYSVVKNINCGKFILIDNNFKTNIENIYAIGDVNGLSMLAHSASHQAIELIDYIVSSKSADFYANSVPSVIYGTPEIAWVGKTEQYLIENNIQYEKSLFPIAALGKANADNCIEGFIKILASNDKIFGVHIISQEASSILQNATIAIDNNISIPELLKSIYPHPTYDEGFFEAMMGIYGKSISLPPLK